MTGYTAVAIDISNRLTDALVPFALIVVGLSIVLLHDRVPLGLRADQGRARLPALGRSASLGVTVAIFQWGWFADLAARREPGPILSFMPILLMAVLFGLAMDYEVFLVSGMREEFVKTKQPRIVDRARLPARGARGHRRGAHHVLRLLRLRARGRGRHQGHRLRARGRRRLRRVPRAHDARARRHGAGRQGAPGGCRSGSRRVLPERRHRGRGAARPPRTGGLGRGPARRGERRRRGVRPARAPHRPDHGRGARRRRARRARRVRRPPRRRGDARRSPGPGRPVASPCSACRCRRARAP